MPGRPGAEGSDAVEVLNARACGPAVILCEHAARRIPARYGGLGLTREAARSHAAWDPGARALALLLAEQLEAPVVAGRVSRLVYDCNRPPEAASAMPERSEAFEIPGNRGLDAAARQERIAHIYRPFCAAVQAVLDAREAAGVPTALVTVHSFTPTWHGVPRTVEIGVLHDSDTRLADAMLARKAALPHRAVCRNAPYGPQDGVTHSLRCHGIAQGLANVMLEVRNDLLGTPAAQQVIAGEIMAMLAPALAELVPAAEGVRRA